jgi:hypothetical protein
VGARINFFKTELGAAGAADAVFASGAFTGELAGRLVGAIFEGATGADRGLRRTDGLVAPRVWAAAGAKRAVALGNRAGGAGATDWGHAPHFKLVFSMGSMTQISWHWLVSLGETLCMETARNAHRGASGHRRIDMLMVVNLALVETTNARAA